MIVPQGRDKIEDICIYYGNTGSERVWYFDIFHHIHYIGKS